MNDSIVIIDDPGYEHSDKDYYLNLTRFDRDANRIVIVSKFHEEAIKDAECQS